MPDVLLDSFVSIDCETIAVVNSMDVVVVVVVGVVGVVVEIEAAFANDVVFVDSIDDDDDDAVDVMKITGDGVVVVEVMVVAAGTLV